MTTVGEFNQAATQLYRTHTKVFISMATQVKRSKPKTFEMLLLEAGNEKLIQYARKQFYIRRPQAPRHFKGTPLRALQFAAQEIST